MGNSKLILTYGLDKSELEEIEIEINKNDIITKNVEGVEELFSSKYFLSIVNLDKVSKNELNELINYYLEVDGGLSQKIFIGKDNHGAIKKCNTILKFKHFDEFKNSMNSIIEKAYSKAKRADNNISAVINIISVLNKIENNPGILTEELAKDIDKNENAIKRYIEMLNVSGKSIIYNYENKGWYIKSIR